MRARLRRLRDHRVARNAGALGVVQVLNYGAALVVLVHLTRVLGVSTYGVVAFSIGITQVLSVVLDLGFAMSATERIAVHRENRKFVGRLSGAVLLLKLAAFVAGALMVTVYAVRTEKYAEYSALFMLSLLPLLGHALQPWWFFQGIERMRYLSLFTGAARLAYVASVVLFVRTEADFLWVPIADGIAQLGAAALGLHMIRSVGYRVMRPRARDVAYAWRRTTGFLWSRTASTVQSNSGILLLGLVAAPATVAIYSLAEQMYRLMHSVFSPVTHALYPYMAKERKLGVLARIAVLCVALAAVGSVAGHFLLPVVIPALLSSEWMLALPVIDVFFVAVTVHVVVLMAGYPLAAALDRLDVVNRAVVLATVLHLTISGVLLLARAATPIAFAWVLVASESFLLVYSSAQLLPLARRQHALLLAEQGR